MSFELSSIEHAVPPPAAFGSEPNDESGDDTDADHAPYRTNVPALTRRLALRFVEQEFDHPVAAAVAVTLRGLAAVELTAFARMTGVKAAELRLIESGDVDFAHLPEALTSRMVEADLDLDSLGALSRRFRST